VQDPQRIGGCLLVPGNPGGLFFEHEIVGCGLGLVAALHLVIFNPVLDFGFGRLLDFGWDPFLGNSKSFDKPSSPSTLSMELAISQIDAFFVASSPRFPFGRSK